jgi:hypothetical protein
MALWGARSEAELQGQPADYLELTSIISLGQAGISGPGLYLFHYHPAG